MQAEIGGTLGLVWALPFAGLLLSIALMPLLAPRVWHRHYGKIAAFWGIAFVLPFAVVHGLAAASHAVLDAFFNEYLPFVALLGALYTVAGGVRLTGTLRGTPAVNTVLLLVGTLIASVIGTTGAAMLLVRPLIRANRRRRHVQHIFVFFIILVANVGGALSPLGDPPLFLGFLQGVPFFWPLSHLAVPTGFIAALLLAVFYAIEHHYHRAAPAGDPWPLDEFEKIGESEKVGIAGKSNLVLLLAITAIVLMSGVGEPGLVLTLAEIPLEGRQLLSIVLLVGVALLSLRITAPAIRRANHFTWAAMREVAILFAAIFATIIPAILILHAKAAESGGALGERGYFWATGLLSAFLDNAPTYLLFFNLAGGDPAVLSGPRAATLLAISAGAVFFGALTYIGNAPNFMVKAIVEETGLTMPSFFGFMAWSAALLLPLFIAVTFLFLSP
jgi:Na+/H+ antiporter NhaD/arsenite permease-like protein